jgi:hypothetical protein
VIFADDTINVLSAAMLAMYPTLGQWSGDSVVNLGVVAIVMK